MKILAIESSCDDTGAAVLEKENNRIKIFSNVISSSIDFHVKTGGIIPEDAAREQVKVIIPVIVEALLESRNLKFSKNQEKNFLQANKILKEDIEAIAVTYGPGLIGSLLIGTETAKSLSFALNKPLVTVNHLLAHIYANFIENEIHFPFIGLVVSGGHTDLLYFENHGKFKWLGGTRDDAAGEAFDKIGRLLGLPYPAGPIIEKRAKEGRYIFKSPLMGNNELDFSFSGLKTEVMREVQKNKNMDEQAKDEICFAVQKAITDVLVEKTINAAIKFDCPNIVLGGGVSANSYLREQLSSAVENKLINSKIFYPKLEYCTDNAAMVGTCALFNYEPIEWESLRPQPDLYFD